MGILVCAVIGFMGIEIRERKSNYVNNLSSNNRAKMIESSWMNSNQFPCHHPISGCALLFWFYISMHYFVWESCDFKLKLFFYPIKFYATLLDGNFTHLLSTNKLDFEFICLPCFTLKCYRTQVMYIGLVIKSGTISKLPTKSVPKSSKYWPARLILRAENIGPIVVSIVVVVLGLLIRSWWEKDPDKNVTIEASKNLSLNGTYLNFFFIKLVFLS